MTDVLCQMLQPTPLVKRALAMGGTAHALYNHVHLITKYIASPLQYSRRCSHGLRNKTNCCSMGVGWPYPIPPSKNIVGTMQ